jgi:hypothetical protein
MSVGRSVKRQTQSRCRFQRKHMARVPQRCTRTRARRRLSGWRRCSWGRGGAWRDKLVWMGGRAESQGVDCDPRADRTKSQKLPLPTPRPLHTPRLIPATPISSASPRNHANNTTQRRSTRTSICAAGRRSLVGCTPEPEAHHAQEVEAWRHAERVRWLARW